MAQNLLKKYTYPHADSRIKDESIGNPTAQVILPLHRPIVPIRAAKGEVNVIGWYTGAEAIAEFGEATFDPFSDYYRGEQILLEKAIFQGQGCMLVRLADPNAAKASLVLEAHVTENVEIQQYERDANGGFVYDAQGKTIPLLDGSNNPLKEVGVKIRHVVRQMLADEVPGNIQPRTVTVGAETTTIYPLLDVVYRSPGLFGNKAGIKFYFDYITQDEDIHDSNGSVIFTLAPMEQAYGSDTPSPVRDIYGNPYCQFVVKPNQVDSRTARRISAADMIKNSYTLSTGSKENVLPFDVMFYEGNFKTIGDKVVAVETNNADLSDGWMVDILSCQDLKGYPYYRAIIDTTGTGYAVLNDLAVHYLQGGNDGDISDSKFEELFREFLSMNLIPEIQDTARYPVTHMYDIGYTLPTKLAMIQFMGKHKMCKVDLACQDSSEHLYSMEESISVGTALRSRCLLTPESEIHGTSALRAEIFGQAGLLTDKAFNQIVPATLWLAMRRAELHNSTFIKGEMKGLPNSRVNIFREHNWVPASPDQKQMCWDAGVNYFQYEDMQNLFFADIRTIYKYDSSVLSDLTFTDACIYLMYIVQTIWAKYAGVTVPAANLYSSIKRDIEKAAFDAFDGKYKITATPYQTADEVQEGDVIHIETEMIGYSPSRRWVNDIVVKRENLINTES